MFLGKSLDLVAQAIIDQSRPDVSRTFTVPASMVAFASESGTTTVSFKPPSAEAITGTLMPLAERQMCAWAKIPVDYFKRMRSGHDVLLEQNMNYWMQDAKPDVKRMLRLFFLPDGNVVVRAWLSARYRPLDHIDLLVQITPRIQRAGVKIVSAELTEERFYLRAVEPAISGTITKMDGSLVTICAGVSITNSEVGAGRLSVEGMLLQGGDVAMLTAATIRKNHAGRAVMLENDDEFEDSWEFFRDTTRKLDDDALWAKVGDTIDAALEESRFTAELARLQEKAYTPVNVSEFQIVEIATKRFKLTEDERERVLGNLFRQGDTSLLSISTAIAKAADGAGSYDRAYEIERAAADALNMSPIAFGDKTSKAVGAEV